MCCVGTVTAQAVPWQDTEFYYFAQDDDLKDLLKNFCLSQGINALVNEEITDKVSGVFENLASDQFLNKLCKAYSLVWFYDGNILYIDSFDKIESKIIKVGHTDAVQVTQVLSALGIEGSNFSIRGIKDQGVMFVSGSPRFVQTVSDLIETLEDNQSHDSGRQGVQVFPLKYSWAYDLNFTYNDSNLTIPGIATVLKNLMGQISDRDTASKPSSRSSADGATRKQTGQGRVDGLIDSGNDNPFKPASQSTKSTNTPDKKGTGVDANFSKSALIESDVRLNAIIVKDSKDKLPMYKDLIDSLDIPVEVISISADIIDITVNNTLTAGVNYAGSTSANGNNKFAIAPGGATNSGAFGALTSGFNASLGFPVSRAAVIAQVSALEQDGKAKVLSRPSLLTLDNVEATINRTDTIHTKVTSTYDAGLFQVSSGTTLKVTPHVIRENDLTKIKLLVSISDGTSDATGAVDSIPLVHDSTITTQAVIMQGQSLLIGGYFHEERSKTETGVPLLRNIPILGYLFKNNTVVDSTLERVFLITPKVIDITNASNPNFEDDFSETYYDVKLKNAQQAYSRASYHAVETEADTNVRTHVKGTAQHKVNPRASKPSYWDRQKKYQAQPVVVPQAPKDVSQRVPLPTSPVQKTVALNNDSSNTAQPPMAATVTDNEAYAKYFAKCDLINQGR